MELNPVFKHLSLIWFFAKLLLVVQGKWKRGRPKATWPRTVEIERNTWAEARVAAANKDKWRPYVPQGTRRIGNR